MEPDGIVVEAFRFLRYPDGIADREHGIEAKRKTCHQRRLIVLFLRPFLSPAREIEETYTHEEEGVKVGGGRSVEMVALDAL